DVFPAAADEPARAEWLGDTVDTLRIFDPVNQRSVMGLARLVVRPGKELLIGPERGAAATARIRESLDLAGLRPDVAAEWEDDHPGFQRTAGERADGALDVGWTDAEPLVGRPGALGTMATQAARATVVLATAQGDRLEALLDSEEVRTEPADVDLDADLPLNV